jgi:hypothetical protein
MMSKKVPVHFPQKDVNLEWSMKFYVFLRLTPLTPDIEEGKRIFNPIIRKAYNLMEARKTTNIPGAQEQHLGV